VITRIFPDGPYEFLAAPPGGSYESDWVEVVLDDLVPGAAFTIRYEDGSLEGPYEVMDHGEEGGHPWVEYDDGSPGNLMREVRVALDKVARLRLPPLKFDVQADPTPEDVAAGILKVSIKIDAMAFFGRTAGELRQMGLLNAKSVDVPDCAVLGPNGFEWVTVEFSLSAKTPNPPESKTLRQCSEDELAVPQTPPEEA